MGCGFEKTAPRQMKITEVKYAAEQGIDEEERLTGI
jgi:hypothetical protein